MTTADQAVQFGLLMLMLLFGVAGLAVRWWGAWVDARDMSSAEEVPAPAPPVAEPVAAMLPEAVDRSLTPGNAVNAELPDNAVVPAEAREIIRTQAKAEAVAALLKSAKLTNKAETIEIVFGCSRSGRPGSPYARAVVAVDALIERFPPLTPEQAAERQRLGLA